MNNWLADHGSAIGLTRSDVEDWQKACGKALSEAQFIALFQKLLGYCEIPAHFTEPKESGEEMAALASACDQSQLASRVLLARLLVWLELTLKRAICWRPPGAEPGRDYEATEPTFLWCAFRVAGLSERDLASTHEAAKLRAIRWLISDVLMQKSEGWAPSSDEMFTNFAGLIGADPTIPEDLKPQVDRVKMFWFIDNAAELPSTECDVLLNKGEVVTGNRQQFGGKRPP